MDPLVTWLLILLTALAIACQTLYLRMRRAESVRNAVESLHEEETQNLEATLTVLVRDEPHAAGEPSTDVPEPVSNSDWRPQALLLARCGVAVDEIARRLSAPAGEVELVLALAQTAESKNRGREEPPA